MISSLDRLLGTLSYVIAAFSGMLIVGCRLPKKVHFALRAASACAFICLMRYLLMNYVLPALQLPMGTALSWIICTINLQVFVLCFFSVGFCYNTNIWASLNLHVVHLICNKEKSFGTNRICSWAMMLVTRGISSNSSVAILKPEN